MLNKKKFSYEETITIHFRARISRCNNGSNSSATASCNGEICRSQGHCRKPEIRICAWCRRPRVGLGNARQSRQYVQDGSGDSEHLP